MHAQLKVRVYFILPNPNSTCNRGYCYAGTVESTEFCVIPKPNLSHILSTTLHVQLRVLAYYILQPQPNTQFKVLVFGYWFSSIVVSAGLFIFLSPQLPCNLKYYITDTFVSLSSSDPDLTSNLDYCSCVCSRGYRLVNSVKSNRKASVVLIAGFWV